MTKRMSIVGAGKLGKAIGKLLLQAGGVNIVTVYNRSIMQSEKACRFIGSECGFVTDLNKLPVAELVFISTPDDVIQSTCDKLVAKKIIKPGNIVFHCSGSLSSTTLASASNIGSLVASVHPMRSFADPLISVSNFPGTYCAIEGDEIAVASLTELFTAIGAIVYPIDAEQKGHYHIAGVMASNYLVTLADVTRQCFAKASIHDEQAMELVLNLMQGTLANLKVSRSPRKSLTGPIKRGDIKTLESHLDHIDNNQIAEIYRVLGCQTITLADLSVEKVQLLSALLRGT